jgi:hypothetical protein
MTRCLAFSAWRTGSIERRTQPSQRDRQSACLRATTPCDVLYHFRRRHHHASRKFPRPSHAAPSSHPKMRMDCIQFHVHSSSGSVRHRLTRVHGRKSSLHAVFRSSLGNTEIKQKVSNTLEHVVGALTERSREKRAVPDAGSTYTGGGRRAMNFPASESHASMRGCCAPARAAIARKQLVESAYRFTSRICARRARAWNRCGLRCLNGEAAPERFPTPHSPLAANRLDVRLIF